MTERRSSSRQRSFLRGCIFFNNRRSAVDCLIRDISDTGARLTFSSTVAIPDVADLYIAQREQMLRIRVEWRHGDEAGVTFVSGGQASKASEPARAADGDDLAVRVQKLEAEIAALRRIVKRLQAAVPAADTDVA